MILTETDRKILESYESVIDGLSAYLGSSFEFVLHSLEFYEHSVIKIINGYHTGRTVGAPITDLALSMLERINSQEESGGYITYFTKNKKGEPLKSTTIAIPGENGRIIGLLCINLYLNTPLQEALQGFVDLSNSQPGNERSQESESFVENIDDLLGNTVQKVRSKVFADNQVPAAAKNKEIVRILADMGIFNIKDSVQKVSEQLNISKNTVYMHIRNLHD